MLDGLIATAVLNQNPSAPSMQCLREVAAISSEPFDSSNDAMVYLATAKFVNIWTSATENLTAEAEAIEISRKLLLDLKAKEAEGGAPPGAYEEARSLMVEELQAYSAADGLRQAHGLAPSCSWPEVPLPVANRLG